MKKTELKIRRLGDVVLATVAKPVAKITEEHRQILSEMARLMYEVQGVGLAAPQVGIGEAMFVADIGDGLYKVINPRLSSFEGSQIMEEGCLSIPGAGVVVKRAKKIMLEGLDETGKPLVIQAEDLLARVFQHEVDHLNGKLIIDHATPSQRNKIKAKLKSFLEIG